MWPKLLLELLPHFTRLVPLADKYFSGRGDQDKAHTAALTALGEEMRDGRAHVDEVYAGLQQTLKEQGEQIAELAVETTRARMAAETMEQRMTRLELATAKLTRIAIAALVLLAAVGAILVVVLFKLKVR